MSAPRKPYLDWVRYGDEDDWHAEVGETEILCGFEFPTDDEWFHRTVSGPGPSPRCAACVQALESPLSEAEVAHAARCFTEAGRRVAGKAIICRGCGQLPSGVCTCGRVLRPRRRLLEIRVHPDVMVGI